MNVVSIDFDIIMEPDINLYNDWVEGDLGINDYVNEHKVLENLKADLYSYEYLTRFLMKAIQKVDAKNVYFIESHETITNFLNENSVDLWNIDHHHDIFYEDEEDVTLPLLTCTCGNWVKYLFDRKKVRKYTWIGNDNSIKPDDEVEKHYPHEEKRLKETNLNKLTEQVDILFICRSPEWVPEYYFPLFDAWIAICEEYYNETFHII